MVIDGVFKNNAEQIEDYQNELKRCLYNDNNGDPVVTMYYAPDGEGSYIRAPSQSLFLWGQSMFIIAQLLTAGLLHINELDPIRRYLPSYNRPRRAGRYSAFQVSKRIKSFNTQIQNKSQTKLNIIGSSTCFYLSLNKSKLLTNLQGKADDILNVSS